MQVVVAFLLFASAWAVESPAGSCGVSPSPECVNDMGSCGNACCAAEFEVPDSPEKVYADINNYLKSSGSDGLFELNGGTGGLNIPTPGGAWTSIFQGSHTTFKARYKDTLNFAVRKVLGGGSIVRMFSISDISGALGDMGQNRRTMSLLAEAVGLGQMKVLFGCGTAPSLPQAGTGEESSTAMRNQQLIEEYFHGVFISSDFNLNAWLDKHLADDSAFQFCPLTAANMPQTTYPHCTNAQGKEAYLRYVELDGGDFSNTRMANASFAVTADGLQVFSRYKVTGTLKGQVVPWFDQVMAWTFDNKGQIKQTAFWSDTLYWNHLYQENIEITHGKHLNTEVPSPLDLSDKAITLIIGSGTFMLGLALGRVTRKNDPDLSRTLLG